VIRKKPVPDPGVKKTSGSAALVMDVYFTPKLFSGIWNKLPEEGLRKDFQK
jgi:hypothetical protein